MGSKKKINTSLRSTPMKQGFSRESVDNLLATFNNLSSATKRVDDIKQTQVADVDPEEAERKGFARKNIEASADVVKNIQTAIQRRQADIMLRRTQPGEAQTRLLQNVSRL